MVAPTYSEICQGAEGYYWELVYHHRFLDGVYPQALRGKRTARRFCGGILLATASASVTNLVGSRESTLNLPAASRAKVKLKQGKLTLELYSTQDLPPTLIYKLTPRKGI